MNDNQLVVLMPKQTSLHTILNKNKKCVYFSKDYSKSKHIYSFKDACLEIDKRLVLKYNNPWIKISARRYMDMLEVLPPLRWHQMDNYSIFAMSEFMEDAYTSFYIYYHKRYYTAVRNYYKSDEELLTELKKQLGEL